MAKVEFGRIYQRGKKGTWWIEYQAGGRRIHKSLKTTKQREAERRRDIELAKFKTPDFKQRVREQIGELEAEIAEADAIEQAADEAEREDRMLPVAEAWQAFVDAPNRRKCSEVTLRDYSQRWGKFLDWWADNNAGREHMEAVTVDDAEQFAAWVDGQGLSPNRRNKIIQTARYVFATLCRRCGNMVNPFGETAKAGIQNVPQQTQSRRNLSEGELRAVVGKAEGELRTLLAIGIFTGLRLGDACTLSWDAVQLHGQRPRLTVQPRKTRSRSGKVVVIPMHPALRAILEETAPPEDRRGYVMPKTAGLYLKDRHGPATVSKSIQQHFRACDIRTREGDEAAAKADTPEAKAEAREKAKSSAQARCLVGFHSLRHSFVSIAAEAGVPLAVVQELCGHGSPAIQRAYLHMGDEATAGAIAALPDVTAPKVEGKALPAGQDPRDARLARIAEIVGNRKGKVYDELRAVLAG